MFAFNDQATVKRVVRALPLVGVDRGFDSTERRCRQHGETEKDKPLAHIPLP